MLRLDWCSYEAARYAVEHWHYSRSMPVGKTVRIGVWESGIFIGVVVFAWGANPYMASTLELQMTECAELVRVALREHLSPVSRILSIALKMLRFQSPRLKAVVSYADPHVGHVGGIYQAGGWVYIGCTKPEVRYALNGKVLHRRGFTGQVFGRSKKKLPTGATPIQVPGKHKYVMSFDTKTREEVILLSKPYPKRERSRENAAVPPSTEGGVIPTRSLHPSTNHAGN